MTKKRSSEIFILGIFMGKNRNLFPKIKIIKKFWSANFFRPPKLGARSQPMGKCIIGFGDGPLGNA